MRGPLAGTPEHVEFLAAKGIPGRPKGSRRVVRNERVGRISRPSRISESVRIGLRLGLEGSLELDVSAPSRNAVDVREPLHFHPIPDLRRQRLLEEDHEDPLWKDRGWAVVRHRVDVRGNVGIVRVVGIGVRIGFGTGLPFMEMEDLGHRELLIVLSHHPHDHFVERVIRVDVIVEGEPDGQAVDRLRLLEDGGGGIGRDCPRAL